MRQRSQNLLYCIVDEYIKTAQPVASNLLVQKYNFNLSSATIRNEMIELEKNRFIYQPHISAGRIPTEKGYIFYIENFLKEDKLTKQITETFKNLKTRFKKDRENLLKQIGKRVADLSKETVIIAFSPNNIYYTGISNLFAQPEFQSHDLLYEISLVIDHLDRKIGQLFKRVDDNVKILAGQENPLAKDCSIIFTPFEFIEQKGFFCLLGPLRMNYQKNLALIKFIHQLL